MAAAAAKMKGKLSITFHKCSELRDVQLLGKQDPYIKANVGSEKFQTKVHENGGKNPVWEQSFLFNLDGTEDFLHLTFWDKENLLDRQIGRADIALNALAEVKEAWFDVNDQDNFKKVVGKLQITSHFEGTGGPAKKEEPKPVAAAAPAPAPVQQPVVQQQPQVVYVQAPPQPQVVYMQAPQPQVVYVQAPQPMIQPVVQPVVQQVVQPVAAAAAAPAAGKYIVSAAFNKQITSDGVKPYLSTTKGQWEQWNLVQQANGTYLITSVAHKGNLGAKDNGITYLGNKKDAAESWTLQNDGKGGYFFTNVHTKKQLMADQKDALHGTSPNKNDWERFLLQ